MMWNGYVARMGREEALKRIWLRGTNIRDHWKDLGVVGRIKLKWALER
jgi:hypothetical protein